MSDSPATNHDQAHQLFDGASAALAASEHETAIAKAEEALELFWEVDEPCHGISESLSLLGLAYEATGDVDAARDVRFNNLMNFVGDSDYDEVTALMDVARQHEVDGDLMGRRIHWLAAAGVSLQLAADDEEDTAKFLELAGLCMSEADRYEHDVLVEDFIEVVDGEEVATEA